MMKIETDNAGRRTYKFSHSVCQGGYLYVQKLSLGLIQEKEELRSALIKLSSDQKLMDVTIRVYDRIFFIFCLPLPTLNPLLLFNAIKQMIAPYGDWSEEYVWTTVYDLQERFVRYDLEKMGFDYEKG